jgi:hypothetical protein
MQAGIAVGNQGAKESPDATTGYRQMSGQGLMGD